MLAPVGVEVLVDPVGHPQQGQLPQRGEVSGAEVVRERRVDLVRLVDVAVRHPPPERLWRHVDELHLVGAADDLVGDGLLLPYPGDGLHDIAQRLQVLDVDRRDDVDAGRQQLLHVLPALGVAGAGDVGVGELVDQHHLGAPGQDGVDVHLREGGVPVLQILAPDLLQAVQHHLGARPVVVLHERDHAVGAAFDPPVRLGEHRVRLADAGCRTEVDPKFAACHVHPSKR